MTCANKERSELQCPRAGQQVGDSSPKKRNLSLLIHMSFQIRKTFVYLKNRNDDMFDEIRELFYPP